MKIHESAEDYLESIFTLREKHGSVRSIDIVNDLGVSKPSVSVAMKNLRMQNYITISEDGFIYLTEEGRKVAEMIYDRHETLTSFLTKLGVPREIAEEDACRVEHVISPETFSAIKQHLEKGL